MGSGVTDRWDTLLAEVAGGDRERFALLKAIMHHESRGNPQAYRAEPQIGDASRGLFQVLYRTAQGLGYQGTPDGLFDPRVSAELAARYLDELEHQVGRYGFFEVLSGYNCGAMRMGSAEAARYGRVAWPWRSRCTRQAGGYTNQSYANSVGATYRAVLAELAAAEGRVGPPAGGGASGEGGFAALIDVIDVAAQHPEYLALAVTAAIVLAVVLA